MNGTITYYYGRALTAQGEKHLYAELIEEANDVTFLIGAYGCHISQLLRELGYFFIKQGEAIEWFYDALAEDVVEALYVRSQKKLFIQDKDGLPRAKYIGSRHKVVSFYDCYDELLLAAHEKRIEGITRQQGVWREKLFTMLEMAKQLHDDWEIVNQQGMNWKGLDDEREALEQKLFHAVQLKKKGQLSHRLLGTLTGKGPRDTLENITKDISQRLFIKGYPGTGKSSFMKRLAVLAIERGLDAQLVWCGLDSASVDMLIVPELSFCIFDSTEPHVYFPNEQRQGDAILDIGQYCQLTVELEKKTTNISIAYKEAMITAQLFAKHYAEKIQEERQIFDEAILKSAWNEQCGYVLEHAKNE